MLPCPLGSPSAAPRQSPPPPRVSRRTVLQLAAGAAAGPFVFTPARAQGFSWRRFQGKELFLLLTKHPFIDVLEKHIPEFESLTGMKVKWETLPEIQARQKMTVEMTAASGGIDAFFTSLHVEKKRFWKAGSYHPLNKFLDDQTLTSPDFDWNDFTPGARAGVTQPDGSISALAAFVDANVVFYRKDLFGSKGLTPPKTLADLEPLVQKLHAPPSTYGIVLRGLKNANATSTRRSCSRWAAPTSRTARPCSIARSRSRRSTSTPGSSGNTRRP